MGKEKYRVKVKDWDGFINGAWVTTGNEVELTPEDAQYYLQMRLIETVAPAKPAAKEAGAERKHETKADKKTEKKADKKAERKAS